MDFRVYWLLEKEDLKNLKYCFENFSPTRFYIGNTNKLEGFARSTILNENLEGKILNFKKKKNGFLFLLDNKEIYLFKKDTDHGFTIRSDLNEKIEEISVLNHSNYKNGDFLQIYFNKKIEIEPTKIERAPGIPFYRIKKS